MRHVHVWMMIALATAIFAVGCKKKSEGDKTGQESAAVTKVEGAVDFDLYIMAKCPYGVMAANAVVPAIEQLGDGVNFKLNFIGTKKEDGSLDSMHGAEEVEGDLIEICASTQGTAKLLKFLTCFNKEWQKIPKGWEACAKEAGIDEAKLKACKDGDEGKKLLTASFDAAQKAQAMGSPTIKLNGEAYKGGRKTNDFLRGICNAFAGKAKPKACSDIPEPAKVNVIAITDARCKDCEADKIIDSLKQVFPGLQPRTLDWSDEEAKAIAKEASVKMLPAILFDDSIDKDKEGAEHMARWLVPAGKYKSLRVPAEFDPTAEICDNKTDDTGNGKVDCDDETCKDNLLCREEKKGQLDVFVMSQCPYGVMGLNAMKEVLGAFGKDMTFNVHYIADGEGDALQSMHGPGEVAEDIRELCAMKNYAKDNKFMDYIWCRNENIRSEDWKSCAKDGIKADVIEKCSTSDEGKKLLEEDLKIAKSLKIGGSPTWLVNNRTTFNGVAAADIQKNFCDKNGDLAGCKKQLAAAPASAPQGSCGGK